MTSTLKFDQQRAKAIGRALFQKYDIYKSSILQPKQCYELFSDFCYRILNVPNTPTMQEANSMHQVMDYNKDKKVTVQDFENLAVKYLCGQGFSSNSFKYTPIESSSSNVNISTRRTVTSTKVITQKKKNLTPLAMKRLDVVRRLFERFDNDKSGYLTQQQIPKMLEQTYKQMGQVYKPTKQDVSSYMKMVDQDHDGKVSLDQFEQIVLQSLRKAGFQVYQNQIY